jgi:hypothetical protein
MPAKLLTLLLSNITLGVASNLLLSSSLLIQPAFADRHWVKCSFNGRDEECEFAGSSSSFTVTYRSDRKKIEVEKVGSPFACGDGSSDECGKMLITETKERRTTWATYRITPNAVVLRSQRGNNYRFPGIRDW